MKRKFFLKNLVVFLIPLLIPLVIFGSLSIVFTQSYIKNNIDKNNMSLLKQTNENIELVLNEIDQLSLIFDVNSQLSIEMDSILGTSEYTYKSNIVSKVLSEFLSADQNARAYIQSIYVYYDFFGDNFYSSVTGKTDLKGYYDNTWFESYRSQDPGKNLWTVAREVKRYDFEKNPTQIISIYHRMLSRKGVIVLNILPQNINDILKSTVPYPQQNLFIENESRQILFSNTGNRSLLDITNKKISESDNAFFTIKDAGKDYVVSQIQSQRYGWRFISITPQQVLYSFPAQLKGLMLLLLLAAVVLGLGLTYYITNKNYNQISNIINILDSAENGIPLPPLPDQIKDEYGYIINNILKTFIEQSYLKVTLSERKYRMRVMELMALQGQINHHFLFNTMKTIYWKSFALTGNSNAVCEMIENLSDILNYSLESAEKAVDLGLEIDTTRSYINIQKVRYKDKFVVIWEYDEELTKQSVMKLILQPLIENCIYHGFTEKTDSCMIKIKIFLSGSSIVIAVIDNGIGIEKTDLQEIREKLDGDGTYSEHIGLFNVNKRLKVMYGDEYGIRIRSKFGLGTGIYVNIPVAP